MTHELSADNLQALRTAADYLPWVEQCIETAGSTKEGKRDIRLRRGLAKPLVEEALPIGIFATHHFGDSCEVSLRLVLGNQNFDAEVSGENSEFSYIEVTQAHEGENEHLRMLVLEAKGHVSMTGEVQKSGTKATGIAVEVEGAAVSHEQSRGQELDRVGAAIERKIDKDYPEQTALLVVFDDYISMQDDDDISALSDSIQEYLPRLEGFCWLAVVGWSKKTILEFDLRQA